MTMAKITAYRQTNYGSAETPCSIADAVTGSEYQAGYDSGGQIESLSHRLTKLAEIVGALAEYAVRSGDEQLGHDLANAMHWRYSIEVE